MFSHSLAAWFIRSKFCDHSGNYSVLLKAINVVIYCVHKKVKRIKSKSQNLSCRFYLRASAFLFSARVQIYLYTKVCHKSEENRSSNLPYLFNQMTHVDFALRILGDGPVLKDFIGGWTF